MRKKVANRTLECFLCHQVLKDKVSNLRRHMKLHEPDVKGVKCSECDKTFQNKSNFKTHWLRRHHNQQPKGIIMRAFKIVLQKAMKSEKQSKQIFFFRADDSMDKLQPAPSILRITKIMLLPSVEVPDILDAVGLIRKPKYAKKCYAKTKPYHRIHRSNVTLELVDLEANLLFDFGKINWQTKC